MSRAFTARYPGRCAACDEGIKVGDTLVYDEDDAVVHADCQTRPSRTSKPPVI